jgi:hypothetical protein
MRQLLNVFLLFIDLAPPEYAQQITAAKVAIRQLEAQI